MEKHYSDCCGVVMDGAIVDIGVCPRCNEHCDVVTDADGDYIPGLDDGEEPDGQPDEYTEWQDVYGGDDWDHGQFDNGDW